VTRLAFAPAAFAIALGLVSMFGATAHYKGGPSALLLAGETTFVPAQYRPGVYLHPGIVGFDGQFYFLIAQDPWIMSDRWRALDLPLPRYQRIFYPALGWILSGGGAPSRLPVALLLANLLGLAAGALFVARIAARLGRGPWEACGIGCLFPLFPGLIHAATYCLTDVWAAALVAGSLSMWLNGRARASVLFACLAALTREETLVYSTGFALALAIRREKVRNVAAWFLPHAAYLLWVAYVSVRTGAHTLPFFQYTGTIGIPFVAVAKTVMRLASPAFHSPQSLIEAAYILFLIGASFLAFRGLFAKGQLPPERVAFACEAAFQWFVSEWLWSNPANFLRLGCLLWVFALYRLAQGGSRVPIVLAILMAWAGPVFALRPWLF